MGIGIDGAGNHLCRASDWSAVPTDMRDYGNDPLVRKVAEIRESFSFKTLRKSPRSFSEEPREKTLSIVSELLRGAGVGGAGEGGGGYGCGGGERAVGMGGGGRDKRRSETRRTLPGAKFGIASLKPPPPGLQANSYYPQSSMRH